MTPRTLADYSTDELLYELLKITRRTQWQADPLLFATEVFTSHFSRTPASMHRRIVTLMVGERVGESDVAVSPSLPYPPPLSNPKIILSASLSESAASHG